MTDLGATLMDVALPAARTAIPAASVARTESRISGLAWSAERDLLALEAEWRAFETRATATPLQSFSWISALWTALPPEMRRTCLFVVGRREGRTEMILPLVVRRDFFGTRLGWMCETRSDYNMPLVEPALFAAMTADDVAALFAAVRPLCGNPDAVVLRRQPLTVGGVANPFAAWAAAAEPISAYQLTLRGPWEEFHQALDSGPSRKRQRQHVRKLEEMGRFECREVLDTAERVQLLETLLDWKAEQLAARGARNRMARRADRDYLFELLRDPRNPARLFAAELDGAPIAGMFALDGTDTLLVYQMAYRRGATDRWSPGVLLLRDVMRRLIGEGKSELDLALGDEPYKQDLCDRRLELSASLHAYTPAGQALLAKHRAAMRAKAWLKARPELLEQVLAARARVLAVAGALGR